MINPTGGIGSAPADRKAMSAALRAMARSSLRPAGFTGTLPHLRRVLDDRVDLITVQFSRKGGRFAVNVACSPPEGVVRRGVTIPASEVVAIDAWPIRRLGSPTFPVEGDHWFVFGPHSFEEPSSGGYRDPSQLAADVFDLIRSQAEPWWATKPFPPARIAVPDGDQEQ